MAGFGGAMKNVAIGMASREGKFLIHSTGETRERWSSAPHENIWFSGVLS